MVIFNEDEFVSDEEPEREDCTLEVLLPEPCMGGTVDIARLLRWLLKRLRRTEVVPIVVLLCVYEGAGLNRLVGWTKRKGRAGRIGMSCAFGRVKGMNDKISMAV